MKEKICDILSEIDLEIDETTSTAMILSKLLFQWCIGCKLFLVI